ncbi:MAG: RidA family protein [Gammaproteobacteria bacterium]|nr:RidA family protein [Gammaproteobacteria bacterium]MBU1601108.1 RidA family protein [Gammaproteobacteria bacterium]MBU2434467.1 RidA family protein [Gammaproteobacteria bacterium]MBU2450871.1 RidA family protein [Gammaproteobacteria bacterium]
MSIQRHGTTRRYSDSVVHGGTVYLVEVPANLEADAAAQTANLLASVESLLAQAGSDKSRLLLATIYLADMADYDAMNAVWDAWIPEGHAPTRACLQAKLANPKYRVEMVLTAAVAQD